jgi:hypothetical protein
MTPHFLIKYVPIYQVSSQKFRMVFLVRLCKESDKLQRKIYIHTYLPLKFKKLNN